MECQTEEGIFAVGLRELGDQVAIATLGHEGLLVHEGNETRGGALNEVDAANVVLELDVLPRDALLAVLLLLGAEHVLVELLV